MIKFNNLIILFIVTCILSKGYSQQIPYYESRFDLKEYFKISITVAEKKQMKRAIFMFSQQIKTYPKEALNYLNRGAIYATLGFYPDAIDDYNKAIKIDSLFSEAYYNRGLAKARFGFTKHACKDIQKAAELGLGDAVLLSDEKCREYIEKKENK